MSFIKTVNILYTQVKKENEIVYYARRVTRHGKEGFPEISKHIADIRSDGSIEIEYGVSVSSQEMEDLSKFATMVNLNKVSNEL